MLEINERIKVPDDELSWSFVRSSGPGGQNVNKVASKAVLRWNVAASPSLPDDVKARLRQQQRRRITVDGDLVVTSQRFRDQARNCLDCLDKVREWVLQATAVPKPRKRTRPSRRARARRVADKRHHSATKAGRRRPSEE
jgi:ribosome-associated protein